MIYRNRKASLNSLPAIAWIVLCGMLLTHCKKFEVERQVILTTDNYANVTYTTVTVTGTMMDLAGKKAQFHGFHWSESGQEAHPYDTISLGETTLTGQFTGTLENLTPGKAYHVWTYINDGAKEYAAAPIEFTTLAAEIPRLETGNITNVTSTTAECECNVTWDGESPVTDRGVCWGKEPLPTLETGENHTSIGEGTGTFTAIMTGLTPGEDYYVRAYAKNSVGTNYGNQQTFGTPPTPMEPVVETSAPKEVTGYSAVLGGVIVSDGFAEIELRGIYWSLNPNPGVEDNTLTAGNGPGSFELLLSELMPGTEYFYRAFAKNAAGIIGTGDPMSFKTEFVCGEPFIDERDGQKYSTIQIGEQCWMAKNLNVGIIMSIAAGQNDNMEIEKYCYDENPDNCIDYGGLYTWYEAMQYSEAESAQGVCPEGWHIPSDGEWMALERHLGIPEGDLGTEVWRGYDQGGRLKTADKPPWVEPNFLATNSTEFSALPSGMIFPEEITTSQGLGSFTVFWTSTFVEEKGAIYRMLHTDEGRILRVFGDPVNTTPVRCIRD